MKYRVGFIGAGNMGGALLRAAAKSLPAKKIAVCEADSELLERLTREYGCAGVDLQSVCTDCDMIFLGVKPQVMPKVCAEMSGILWNRSEPFTLVSMAAGTSIQKVKEYIGFDVPIIRIMPNTPAAVGEGMILYAPSENVPDDCVSDFIGMMSRAGRFDRIDERLIDAASAVSGCGPAFVYMFIEALADGGVACGLKRAKALSYAAQTVIGAAKTVMETGAHPGLLKDSVCSPGGTTIAGVRELEEHGFRASAMDAVIAAYEKTLELGK